MDRRVVDEMISTKYKKGVEYFCDYTFENTTLLYQGWARCLCKRCGNREMLDWDIMTIHLYRSRFIPNYKHWYLHREMGETVARVRNEQDKDIDRMVGMVMNAAGPEFN